MSLRYTLQNMNDIKSGIQLFFFYALRISRRRTKRRNSQWEFKELTIHSLRNPFITFQTLAFGRRRAEGWGVGRIPAIESFALQS
ncbi:hypothetical protein AS030_17065 [Fictibacillus enclensis]|uniref:Uncharacterized protein n=1 Tax=Fictibacillus enclensis TaxID=1017270 RepID=A0A0V8J4T4_9BACL|nr:hypothetical protein AS030_17065 [Fictibacillus enclensis]